jgi:hypothetical protein
MMAECWRDIADDISAATRHFQAAVELFRTGGHDPATSAGYRDVMAFQHAMQSGYTSFELALRRLLALLDEAVPQGPDWPSALLRRLSKPLEGSRPAVLGEPLARAADELLRFRHVAMHSYDHSTRRRKPSCDTWRAISLPSARRSTRFDSCGVRLPGTPNAAWSRVRPGPDISPACSPA